MRAKNTPADSRHKNASRKRRGAIAVYAAFLMILLMVVLAFSIDVGYMYNMQTELQRSVDAAALAGAGELVNGQDAASERVVEYLVRNPVGVQSFVAEQDEDELGATIATFVDEHEEDMEVLLGHWDADTRSFQESGSLPSTISVSMAYPNQSLFFGRVLGTDYFDIRAEAVAMYQPRDIMLVLDLSGSMNDDTEFKSIGTLGREAVEANLLECYEDLGSPVYGIMQFDPQWITVHGQPEDIGAKIPHVTVEYRYNEVYVTSTKRIKNVILEYYGGGSQQFLVFDDAITAGTFSGTGSYSGDRIVGVYVKSWKNGPAAAGGPNSRDDVGEEFDFDPDTLNDTIRTALDLDDVSYPYESGSWDSFFDYCRGSSGQNKNAGYRYKFGYMNLMNYWLEKKPKNNQTSDLWKVSAQPVTAVKDAVDVFMDYIQEVETNDRVGVAVYNAANGNGELETALTEDFASIESLVRERQAGHYHTYTNIGAGMQTAREQLDANGRENAFKMIVLMTDGKANWVNGGYDLSGAKAYVRSEAQLAAAKRYPIVTISLGAGADTSLMDEVAQTAKGAHFNVPGGQSVAEYSADLLQVFREIADHRPLKLVK